jgi:dihydrofolate synthase/folylpolyglutamate synthase
MKKTEVAIIETGLGGRLDSTNIITPVLSIITNISFDHMQFLGDTLEKIAYEKAGIIKKNIPVVIGEKQSECSNVFDDKAKEMNSELVFASERFRADFSKQNKNGQLLNIFKNQKEIFQDLLIELRGKISIEKCLYRFAIHRIT